MKVWEHLQEAGIRVSANRVENASDDVRPDGVLTLEMDGVRRQFVVEVKSRPPYSGELPNLFEQLRHYSRLGYPLLVTRYISPSLGLKLADAGWSWADQSGNFDIRAPQFRARQRLSASPPKPPRPHIPRGPGALSIIRFLINQSRPYQPFGPSELAGIAGVSQPRATQVLQRLRDARLVSGSGRHWFAEREELLDAFLEQYHGPGGTESIFYSLDSPLDVAESLVRSFEDPQKNVAVSADVGPDFIAPWRRPTHVIAYIRDGLTVSNLDLVEAKSRDDANVILRVPDDLSVFSVHPVVRDIKGTEIACVDVTQMIWDLKNLGGDDRDEAADSLRQWLISRR